MGDFRITIDAVGGHGCDRQKGDGETVYGCNAMTCPDCRLREFLRTLKAEGVMLKGATLQHWPGQPSEVVDTYAVDTHAIVRTRKGSF